MKSQHVANLAAAPAFCTYSRQLGDVTAKRLPAPANHRIRILIADDHPVVRRGIIFCLKQRSNLAVVGEAADGAEALRQARELVPDILLTDVDMPRMTGLEVTEALRIELPRIKVLMLSGCSNSEFVFRCAQAGAHGYILKQASPDEFVRAIETINAGQSFFSSDVANLVLAHMVRNKGQGPNPSELTHREREVLSHIAEGLCNKEIASRLNIGTRTVETHRERLMRKLDIHNIAGLTKFAVANGLTATPASGMASV